MADMFQEEEDFKEKLHWELWRKVARRALQQKGHVVTLTAVAIILAGIDSLFPLAIRAAFDLVATTSADRDEGLLRCGLAYFALSAGLCVCVWIFIYLAGRITTHMSHDIRRDAFAKLQQLSFSYFDKRPVGWLMSRVTSDCSRLSDFVAWGVLDAVWSITFMLGMSAIMFWLNWKLAMLVLSTMPLVLGVSAYFKKMILRSSRAIRKMNSLITASYNEGIMGVRTSKTLAREGENLVEFQKLSTEMFDASMRNAIQSALYIPIIAGLGSLAMGLVLWYGGVKTISQSITLGELVAFMTYATQFFDPVQQLAQVFTQMHRAEASGERIMELLETEPQIMDRAEMLQPAESNTPCAAQTIEFRNVTFSYGDGPRIIENLNLTVRSGETLALVGPTGGGKSTLVSLVCRFYEPSSGEILFDGVDYRRRPLHWLQSNLGIVLQTPHLFSGTIMENIRYGRLNASDDEVIEAAKLVNAHEFISAAEKGYQTAVGEGGSKLSTGQKQLVSFARAILANPRIFVMDEATSSVDTQTEQLIQKGVEQILKGRISFIIAHRLSTIRHADRILVIERGRITEQGSHHELLQTRGHYYELYRQQFVREKEAEVLV